MFKRENIYRSHLTSDLDKSMIGKRVRLSGWVSSVRDHGGVVFIDLRDFYGVMQIIVQEEKYFKISKESTISVEGLIRAREESNINPKLKTGEIELVVEKLQVLGKCKKSLPFEISESTRVSEDVRLKYRYLDLRNERMKENLILRSEVISYARKLMEELGFMEIQTPILTSSSPEGARDYIVPSRLHPGEFYALPQAPQQFKQILMCAGVDKYFQIAPCFRDEDARADRCPGEFYQLDMEMAFATGEDVFAVMEDVLPKIFKKFGKGKVDKVPFERITYKESLERFGTDKPDLRNPLECKNLTGVFVDSAFQPFAGKTVKAICVKTVGESRSFYDSLETFMVLSGAKGLAWIRLDEDKMVGPLLKFLTEEQLKAIIEKCEAKEGDTIFFQAGSYKEATKLIGILRTELAKRLNLIKKGEYKFCWIVDFPMYEINEEAGKIDFCHNPFSKPKGGLEALTTMDPLQIVAEQFDIIVNGIELSSGAVRNADPKVLLKAFEIAGYSEKEVEEKFSALYTAFQYGAPPHAGIAPGIDRMLMLLAEEESIREVVPFPMNKKAQSVMMGAPSLITDKQLREAHIHLNIVK